MNIIISFHRLLYFKGKLVCCSISLLFHIGSAVCIDKCFIRGIGINFDKLAASKQSGIRTASATLQVASWPSDQQAHTARARPPLCLFLIWMRAAAQGVIILAGTKGRNFSRFNGIFPGVIKVMSAAGSHGAGLTGRGRKKPGLFGTGLINFSRERHGGAVETPPKLFDCCLKYLSCRLCARPGPDSDGNSNNFHQIITSAVRGASPAKAAGLEAVGSL